MDNQTPLLNAFADGVNFTTYQESMSTLQRHMAEQFEKITLNQMVIDDFRQAIERHGPLNILVITEDYCPDAVMNIPILAHLAQQVSTLNLQIVRRTKYEDLANQYPASDGYNHIPTIIFISPTGTTLGVWHERPAAAQAFLTDYKRTNPEPEKYLPDTTPNPAHKTWLKDRFQAQKLAYQKELYLDTIYELIALLNRPGCT